MRSEKKSFKLNLDPLSEVTQLNNYLYHEAASEKTVSDLFTFVNCFFGDFFFFVQAKAAKLPRK
jgi:hypothetical protein